MVIGAVLVVIGGLLWVLGKFKWAGSPLPGDIVIERPSFRLYIPLATSLLISIFLSAVFYIISRWLREG
ncbi:MAG: DUF2905 domain-containing protein [Bacteroidia bacterium]|nr:DUF2905 domain-containing protein [Bacteroidia bacterium]